MSILDNSNIKVEPRSQWPMIFRLCGIWAAVGFTITLVGYLGGFDPSLPTTSTVMKWLMFAISMCVTVYFLHTANTTVRNQQDGFIEYGECVGIAAKMGLVGSLFAGLLQSIYSNFINTEYYAIIEEGMRTEFEKKGLDDTQIEQSIEMAQMFQGPMASILIIWIVGFFMTLIVGLIVAAFDKRSAYAK